MSTPRERHGSTRLVTPRQTNTDAPVSSRARVASNFGPISNDPTLIPAAVQAAEELVADDRRADLVAQAVEQMKLVRGNHSRNNFGHFENQAAYLAVCGKQRADIVHRVLSNIAESQSLVNVTNVISIGGGPCTDAFGLIQFLTNKPDRRIPLSALQIRVFDPEPQWATTWLKPFNDRGVAGVDFVLEDFDNATPGHCMTWKIERADLVSLCFVTEPPFCQLWDRAAVVIANILTMLKSGCLVMWINLEDSPLNRLFQKWARDARLEVYHEWAGEVSQLDVDLQGGPDFRVTAKIFSKPRPRDNNSVTPRPPIADVPTKQSSRIVVSESESSSSSDDGEGEGDKD
eukprot:c15312_g1_i1.p1 GENE.c15312_g1_i1~~c15312_g1_i1.p1  ORF type:complete len:356 (+),score=71.98 c15312_g1_i1:36-1070(+)